MWMRRCSLLSFYRNDKIKREREKVAHFSFQLLCMRTHSAPEGVLRPLLVLRKHGKIVVCLCDRKNEQGKREIA